MRCAARTDAERGSGRRGQAGRPVAQVAQHGGEQLLGLVEPAFVATPGRVPQVAYVEQYRWIVEDVGGGPPMPPSMQFPIECLDERPVLNRKPDSQAQQGEGAAAVENALRVAEHRVPRQLGFHRAQHVGWSCFAEPWRDLQEAAKPVQRQEADFRVLHEPAGCRKCPPMSCTLDCARPHQPISSRVLAAQPPVREPG